MAGDAGHGGYIGAGEIGEDFDESFVREDGEGSHVEQTVAGDGRRSKWVTSAGEAE